LKYDVAVVGAGPAGSTTAKVLAEKGVKTVLIDKSKFPRDKPCGGGLPYKVLKRFPYIEKEGLVESYSYGGYAYYQTSKYELKHIGDKPLVGMVLRKKFDYALVKLAIDAGCDFKQGNRVNRVQIKNGIVKIKLGNNEDITSTVVVGADGVNSVVAKETGLRQKGFKIGVCVLQELRLDEKTINDYFTDKKMCYVHSRFKDVPGYGWVFPKREHVNIGIGEMIRTTGVISEKKNLLEIYKEYIRFLKQQKIIPSGIKIGKIIGGALPVYPLDKTYSNRTIIVGDAAGFINCATGEGIYYAMSPGEDAANILVESLSKGENNEDSLSKYEETWMKDFGRELSLFKKLVKRQNARFIEKLFKKAHKDKKLADLLIKVILGESTLYEYKNEIIKRYIYTSIKEMFYFPR